MYELYRNSGIYNIIAEGEIANILSKFDSSYIMDVIDSNLSNRFAYNPTLSNPNIVNSYELNFNGMIDNFPDDADNIKSIRQETYLTIINKICNAFNLTYIGDQPDCYILAYNMYDLFVSGYSRNIINFFSRYIYNYCGEIYNNMGLDKYKKNKDTTTNYIRNDNDVMCDIWCGKDHKVCFDYFKYAKKYARIIKTESDRLIKHYDNIKKIPEFNEAFSHSSSDGIQRFKYDGFVYFVLPTLINALKSEPVSLDVYLDINHLSNNPEDAKSALLMFTIHKKIGDVVVYYRTRIL